MKKLYTTTVYTTPYSAVQSTKAAAPAGRKIYASAGTQDLTMLEAKACGHEDTFRSKPKEVR